MCAWFKGKRFLPYSFVFTGSFRSHMKSKEAKLEGAYNSPYSATFLISTPIFDWYVVAVPRRTNTKNTCVENNWIAY